MKQVGHLGELGLWGVGEKAKEEMDPFTQQPALNHFLSTRAVLNPSHFPAPIWAASPRSSYAPLCQSTYHPGLQLSLLLKCLLYQTKLLESIFLAFGTMPGAYQALNNYLLS